jgi:hypothetical protein
MPEAMARLKKRALFNNKIKIMLAIQCEYDSMKIGH